MSSGKSGTNPGERSAVNGRSLMVSDLIIYFSKLASLNGEYRTGNRELSNGLQQLTKALKPHAGRTISDLAGQIRGLSLPGETAPSKANSTLAVSVESLSHEEVETMLNSDDCTKTQIIEIGTRRFGIPQSRLARANKKDALMSVAAALDHERSLEVIGREAARGGRMS